MMKFYYYEEDREYEVEVVEMHLGSEKKKPIVISLDYFDTVMDEDKAPRPSSLHRPI